MQFGRKSEKLDRQIEQLELKLEELESAKASRASDTVANVASHPAPASRPSHGVPFLQAASPKALKAIRQAIRRWSLQTRSDKALDDVAPMFNPYIRGWINYYGRFYKSAMYPTLRWIDYFLLRWARRKFKRLRQRPKVAMREATAGAGNPSRSNFADNQLLKLG